MSWDRLPRIYRDIATAVCTPAELRILHHRIDGTSQARIAFALGISRSTVRTLEHRAHQKIAEHPDFPKETTA